MAREEAAGLSYAENLREVAKNLYLPQINRLLARVDTNKNLDKEEKARVKEAAKQMLELVGTFQDNRRRLWTMAKGSRQTGYFRRVAFPVFKSISGRKTTQ